MMQGLAELDLPHLPVETAEFAADPFPHFEAARAKHPWLARSDFGFVITEYGAMKDLLANDHLRTANDGVVEIMRAGDTDVGRFFATNIFAQQGETHRRLREALAPIFTPRHAHAIRDLVREVIDDLLDDWVPRCSFQFPEFTSWFPISVLSRMIGGPLDAIPKLKSSLETVGLFFSLERNRMPEIEVAYTVLEDFVRGLIDARRARPGPSGEPDLLDMLIGTIAEGQLSEREVVDLLNFLYSGGYDTTSNVLSLIMREMIGRPALYRACADDAELCRKVVEEMLRYCGVSTSSRVAISDVRYRDVLLAQGTMIFVPVSVAGRDRGSFEGPDRFDPDRPIDPEHRHIAFGRGPHVCIGQHIARIMLQEGLQRIAQRIREPQLNGEIEWRPFPGIWGLKRLPITFAAG
jgi:cytochrome P450